MSDPGQENIQQIFFHTTLLKRMKLLQLKMEKAL